MPDREIYSYGRSEYLIVSVDLPMIGNVTERRYEQFPHGADVGVRGIGSTVAEAFAQAALALTGIVTEPSRVASEERVDISCEAPDVELMLVDFLNAVIYEMATRGLLFGRYEVRVDGERLDASAWGERVDVEKHEPVVEPKGATLTSLRVAEEPPGMWLAQCVIDV